MTEKPVVDHATASRATPNSSDLPDPEKQMFTPAADPDRKLLHVAEEFRRAKRNLLFWSGVTLLLALASDGEEVGVQAPITKGLIFSQELMLLLSCLVLLFMTLSFVRAARRNSVNNSEFAYGRGIGEAADEVEIFAKRVSELNGRVEQADRLIATTIPNSVKKLNSARRDMLEAMRDARSVMDLSKKTAVDLQPILSSIVQLEAQIQDTKIGQGQRKEQRLELAQLNDQKTVLERNLTANQSGADRLMDQFQRSVTSAKDLTDLKSVVEANRSVPSPADEKLADDLRTIANALQGEEEHWLTWFDYRLPALAVFLAGFFALWRLFADERLSQVLRWLRLGVEACAA